MKTSLSEKQLQNKCIDWLKHQSNTWFFKVCASAIQARGIPDLIVCKDGHFYAIELKTPKGDGILSETQKIRIRHINQSGGTAFYTNDFEEFKRRLGG